MTRAGEFCNSIPRKESMTQETLTKRARPAREKDVRRGVATLCDTMSDWWNLKLRLFEEVNDPAFDDDEIEAEQPSTEVMIEVVAQFVARWRNARLITTEAGALAAFDKRVGEALTGALDKLVVDYD
jgi:hypothetical protein